ncbi:MAG: hypothetical protein HYV26_05625 [Candidatus Hydrogenedentes bacterium]|nr:hypothetical protein [Candidatus Hydrogenedentota bacterium]
MKNELCETYRDDMMALLEGVLPSEIETKLREHLIECHDCARELEAFEAIETSLFEAGLLAQAAVPAVSLVENVLQGARKLQQAELVAYLDGELDDTSRAACANRLLLEPELRLELEDLRRTHTVLSAWAASTAPALDINIVDAVMAGIAAPAPGTVDELAERREIRQIEEQLIALGHSLTVAIPTVDLVDGVMQAVARTKPETPQVTPFKARPKGNVQLRTPRRRFVAWLPAAAAAVLLAVAGLAVYRMQSTNSLPPENRYAGNSPPATDTPVPRDGFPSIPPETGAGAGDIAGPQPPGARQSNPRNHKYEGATLKSVLDARRTAMMKDAEALASLANWAELSAEEARALLASAGLSEEALLGAAQFLSADEANAVLKAAVEQHPDNAYLRYALARNYDELQQYEQGRAQLAAWSNIDSENSLPHYMEAEMLLSQGDLEGALEVLNNANDMARASVDASASAQYRQAALIANGMDPDVALLLAATGAGELEHTQLLSLGQELLEYGKYYEELGEYDTAQQIYQAVQQMGLQIDQNAQYASVRLAGADVQYDAVTALIDLYSISQGPEMQYLMETALDGIVGSLVEITNIFTQSASFLAGLSEAALLDAAAQILQGGDSSLFPAYFPGQ